MSRHLADLASGKDLLGLLSVSASVVDVGIGETSSPHHDTAKGRVGGVLADEGVESRGLEVVLSAGLSACCTEN